MKIIDALQLPALQHARVVAGSDGLDREIRWVHIVDVPDPLPWVTAGDFLLTTGYAWPRDEAGQRTFIHELAERGLSGAALAVPRFFDSMPSAARDAANSLNFPLLEIPWEVSFHSITEQILNSILAFHYSLQEQSETIHRELIRIALEATSLHDIARTVAKLVGRNVIIQHPEGAVLANSREPDKEDMAKQFLVRLKERVSISSLRSNSKPLCFAPDPEQGLPERFVCPIHIKRELAGLLWVYEGTEPLSELAVRSVQFAAIVMALHISQQRELASLEAQLGYSFLDALLEGRFVPGDQSLRRAELLGFDPEESYSVGMAVFDLPVPLSREAIMERERSAERMKRTLQELQLPAVLSPVQNRLLFLIPERVRAEQIWRTIESPGVSMAVSLPRRGFEQVQRGYKEVASIIPHIHYGRLHYYKDLLVPRVLLGDSEARASFLDRLFSPVKSVRNGDALKETLLMFAKSGFHLQHTAGQLRIHPKSLRYRLDRIVALCGFELDDQDTRFQLQLAARLDSMEK